FAAAVFGRALAVGSPFAVAPPSFRRGHVVFRSLLLAGDIYLRLMVCAGWRQKGSVDHQFEGRALSRGRLLTLRDDYDIRRSILGFRRAVSAMAVLSVQSQRQDLHGSLPLPAFHCNRDACGSIHSEGLARAPVEGL